MTDAFCDAEAFRCACVLFADQEHSIHECDCGGRWEMREDRLVPWAMPGGPDGITQKVALLKGWKPGT